MPAQTYPEGKSIDSTKNSASNLTVMSNSSGLITQTHIDPDSNSWFMFPEMVNLIGINYSQITNNLLSLNDIDSLVKSIGISKIKLYDADPKVLKAFANTGVEFILGLPAINITCIFIGNKVFTFNDTSLSNNLLPAMQSVHLALVGLGLDKQVAVTTAHSLSILETSYPPSIEI